MKTQMSPHDREATSLAISVEALQNIVNHLLLHFTPVTGRAGEMEVRFHSSAQRDLFLIRVQDFLSEKGSVEVLGSNVSCLEALKVAATERNFEIDGSADLLVSSVHALDQWISTSVQPKLWLPTLEVEATLSATRADLLKIAGNQAKHNPARLSGISVLASRLLREQGHDVPSHQLPFVLSEFREHLQENFFIYYASWIAELLNAVRWAIQRYLEPLYQRSIVRDPDDDYRYRYAIPREIVSDIGRAWFWELMNNIRSRPAVQPFKASRFLREQSSLEW